MLENKEIILSSGNKLTFQYSEFGTQIRSFKTLCSILNKRDISLKDLGGLTLETITTSSLFTSLVHALLDAVCDDEMEKIFYQCANVCLWNGERITYNLFNTTDEAVPDYYELCYYILKENIMRFFPSRLLGSSSKKTSEEGDKLAKVLSNLK